MHSMLFTSLAWTYSANIPFFVQPGHNVRFVVVSILKFVPSLEDALHSSAKFDWFAVLNLQDMAGFIPLSRLPSPFLYKFPGPIEQFPLGLPKSCSRAESVRSNT